MVGIIVEVQRPDLDVSGETYSHSSEKALDGVDSDVVIINDGGFGDLLDKAIDFVRALRSGEIKTVSSTQIANA